MIRFVAFADLGESQLKMLAESINSAHPDNRPDGKEFLRIAAEGKAHFFEWDNGFALLGRRDNRLLLLAFRSRSLLKELPEFVSDLKRLAADWQCDTIETTCFEPRLTSVIQKLGGHVESVTLTLATE